MKSHTRGQDDAAVLYLEPAREKGPKLLRKEVPFDVELESEVFTRRWLERN